MPQPPRLVVMPGSNRVRRISLGTPGPSSITRISPMPLLGSDPQDNRAGRALQRIDRVLHQ